MNEVVLIELLGQTILPAVSQVTALILGFSVAVLSLATLMKIVSDKSA